MILPAEIHSQVSSQAFLKAFFEVKERNVLDGCVYWTVTCLYKNIRVCICYVSVCMCMCGCTTGAFGSPSWI